MISCNLINSANNDHTNNAPYSNLAINYRYEELSVCLQTLIGAEAAADYAILTDKFGWVGPALEASVACGIADGLVDPISKCAFDLPEPISLSLVDKVRKDIGAKASYASTKHLKSGKATEKLSSKRAGFRSDMMDKFVTREKSSKINKSNSISSSSSSSGSSGIGIKVLLQKHTRPAVAVGLKGTRATTTSRADVDSWVHGTFQPARSVGGDTGTIAHSSSSSSFFGSNSSVTGAKRRLTLAASKQEAVASSSLSSSFSRNIGQSLQLLRENNRKKAKRALDR